jgi:hypothetical protein
MKKITAIAALGAFLLSVSCEALLSPLEKRTAAARNLEEELTQIQVLDATACCFRPPAGLRSYSPRNVIDGDLSTEWAGDSPDSTSSEWHAHGTGHFINLDLGQVYENITRVQYIPNFLYESQAPGAGYWVSDPHWMGGANNGICEQFEIYVTSEPVPEGQLAPAEALAGKGEWYNFEIYSNQLQTVDETYPSQKTDREPDAQKFIATFNSVTGRYLQFRFVTAKSNHWSGYPVIPLFANAREIKVFVSKTPYYIDRAPLNKLVDKAGAFRAAYPPGYGYLNAMLDRLAGFAESYESGGGATKEMVDYLSANLQNYISLAPKRMGGDTYDRFVPKSLWADDKGNHLQAHGGGVFYDGENTKKWWFYGEDRTTGGGGQAGVHAYSSEDLYNWKDEGVVLPVFNNTVYNTIGGVKDFWDGDNAEDATHVEGLLYKINRWRKALGDWDADGVVKPDETPYTIDPALKTQIEGQGLAWWDGEGNPPEKYFTDEHTLVEKGKWPAPAEAWAEIAEHIPSGNPPLYISDSADTRPSTGFLGLTASRMAQFNALYKHEEAWRRKQLYRFYNYQSIIERPKVIRQPDIGKAYEYDGRKFPYVMTIHIEGGSYDSSYGTARAAIAVAERPEGPFKFLWAYRIHFVENVTHGDNGAGSKGMSRDQGLLLDTSDNTAYHFGSTEENRIIAINKLHESFSQFEGIPRFAAGGNQREMLIEGYQNRLGVNFNWVYGDSREAPAPFIHYNTAGMTLDSNGQSYPATINSYEVTLGPAPNTGNRYYYSINSGSTGWFTNAQSKYRTEPGGASILGDNGGGIGRSKPMDAGTAQNTGWTWQQNDPGYGDPYGNGNSLLFGYTLDGSQVNRGYDGQTTNVFQLRYPKHPWGIVGYRDENYEPPNPADYKTAREYYETLKNKKGEEGCTKPVYGEQRELVEPRAGRLVYGKYVYLSDSWDAYKNYDARYIWLPLRALPDVGGGTQGLKARWLEQWRWQDFVYELGPFENCTQQNPAGEDIWNDIGDANLETSLPALYEYYEMLGDYAEYKLNAGKQNPGLYDGIDFTYKTRAPDTETEED